jgi:hypothetical protein
MQPKKRTLKEFMEKGIGGRFEDWRDTGISTAARGWPLPESDDDSNLPGLYGDEPGDESMTSTGRPSSSNNLYEEVTPMFPINFRIGKLKFEYFYTYVEPFTYKCSRKSDWGRAGQTLWLKKLGTTWYAYDGADQLVAPIVTNVIFTSEEDILEPGMHAWIMEKDRNKASGQFETVLMP